MTAAMPTAIANWMRVAESAKPEDVPALLAEDCVFESPVVHTPQAGKAKSTMYLQGALRVLNGEHFRYINTWYAERSAVLEFATEIDGIKINGVDLVFWNDQDLITNFRVMLRPLKGINKVHEKMAELLAKVQA